MIETMTLVGTLGSEKGWFAFFDGSRSEFKRVLAAGKSIGGQRIAQITSTAVTLESGTNSVCLKLGMTLQRSEDDWHLLTEGDSPKTPNPASREPSLLQAGTEESDVVRRLILERERDFK